MAFLTYNNPPSDLRNPTMLFAFAGWADASESATHALRYIVRHLKGEKFAEVDPEDFYNFTRVRPRTKFDDQGERYIEWPANEFYAIKRDDVENDLVVFLGVEPNLKWRTFCDAMLEEVEGLGINQVIQVGALLDAVPHTRDARITGTATSPELRGILKGIEVRRSRYTGPTGITGVFTDRLRLAGIPTVSLWGHSPHYLQVSPNPKVSLRLVSGLEQLLDVHVNLDPLRSQGLNFDRRVEQALTDEPDIVAYVQKLEAQFDSATPSDAGTTSEERPGPSEGQPETLDPDQAVRSIEEFLRRQRQSGGSPQDDDEDED